MVERNYGIDDGSGNQLTTGLSAGNVQRVAQRLANNRSENVYCYSLDQHECQGEMVPCESWCVEPETAITYAVEMYADGQWSSDGIGDARGWDSREAAEGALETLVAMGGEWAANEYRVVEVLP